jgi:hypothetical protein
MLANNVVTVVDNPITTPTRVSKNGLCQFIEWDLAKIEFLGTRKVYAQ